jgi:hypothetical protein
VVKLIIAETESEALRTRVHGHILVSSRVAVVEVTKAVAHANPTADAQPLLARLAFVELDAELAATTGSAGVRALDAIHLASALRLADELEAFLTYDERQVVAARSLGLVVETPAHREPGPGCG